MPPSMSEYIYLKYVSIMLAYYFISQIVCFLRSIASGRKLKQLYGFFPRHSTRFNHPVLLGVIFRVTVDVDVG
jgi:hypothetical protein